LKHYYPISDNGQKNKQLGRVYHTTSFQTDCGLAGAPETSADTLQEIHDAIAGSNTVQTAFSTTGKLRNTTGHNLVWDDVFSDPRSYTNLFQQIMNAILFVVSIKGR